MRLLACIFVLVATYAQACINDRDTLAFEIRNIDALNRIEKETDARKRVSAIEELALRAIAGRFERYPPRYYQMRIARLEKQSVLSPAEVDDLAVAYDRLGKVDKAIGIILASKSERVTSDDQYRFHANYGTFLVHRWIKNGHAKADAKTLKESIAEIEAALKINPNSHFGREKVQLDLEKVWLSGGAEWPIAKISKEDQMVGLAGIAMMGLGYELPDIYILMASIRMPGSAGNSMLQGLAARRAEELDEAGNDTLADIGYDPRLIGTPIREAYLKLRKDGETVHQARLAYMNVRFDRGEHPDTDPKFWSEWQEPAVPYLQRINDRPTDMVPWFVYTAGACLVLAAGLGVWGAWRRLRAR